MPPPQPKQPPHLTLIACCPSKWRDQSPRTLTFSSPLVRIPSHLRTCASRYVADMHCVIFCTAPPVRQSRVIAFVFATAQTATGDVWAPPTREPPTASRHGVLCISLISASFLRSARLRTEVHCCRLPVESCLSSSPLSERKVPRRCSRTVHYFIGVGLAQEHTLRPSTYAPPYCA